MMTTQYPISNILDEEDLEEIKNGIILPIADFLKVRSFARTSVLLTRHLYLCTTVMAVGNFATRFQFKENNWVMSLTLNHDTDFNTNSTIEINITYEDHIKYIAKFEDAGD